MPRTSSLLRQQAEAGQHIGIQVAACHRGEVVLNLADGQIGPDDTRPVEGDTLFPIFSAIKGVASLAVHLLVARGQLDLDAPVTGYWPGFAPGGSLKARTTVRQLLSHQAGLHTMPRPFAYEQITDWDAGIHWVEALEPAWEPGAATGYHAVTWGWLVGGLVQQVTGRHIRDVMVDEVTGPLGISGGLYCGVPADVDPDRLASLRIHVAGEGMRIPEDADFYRAMPREMWQHFNSRAYREAPLPSISGHASARALARMYACLAEGGALDGVRLCSRDDVEQMRRLVTRDRDRVLGGRIPKAAGFMLGGDGAYGPLPRGEGAFGHSGAGGTVAFADPERRLAVAITVNNMAYHPAGTGPVHELVQAIIAETDAAA